MSIEKLKELEELKEQLVKAQTKRYEYKETIISELIAAGANDFLRYFSDKGFATNNSQNTFGTQHTYRLSATFKGLSADLEYSLPTQPLFGAEFRYDLNMNIGKKSKYGVLINHLNVTGPRITSRIIKSDEDEINEQIQATKNSIEELKDKPLPGMSDYGFFIRQENVIPDFHNGFKSMYELLESLIN